MPPPDSYSARIRAARAYAGLTQDELAGRLGVDAQTIKRREAGSQHPKRGELLAIAAICGVPASFMEHGFGEVEPHEVITRLDRIEAALIGADLEPMRDYVSGVISELRGDAPAGESPKPTPRPASGQAPAERSKPRARSPRQS